MHRVSISLPQITQQVRSRAGTRTPTVWGLGDQVHDHDSWPQRCDPGQSSLDPHCRPPRARRGFHPAQQSQATLEALRNPPNDREERQPQKDHIRTAPSLGRS